MLALIKSRRKEGKGSVNPSEPQPPPSTAQPTHEEPIPNIESTSLQKTQSPRQALNKDTKLPQTSVPIPYTRRIYGTAYTKLIMKVKKLEKTIKTSQARRRAKIVDSDDDMASEDSSKHGRMIEEIDQDVGVTMVTPTKVMGGVSTAGMIQQVNIIIPSSSATKDKGKAIMTESEPEQTTTKLKQRQERAGYEAAIRLQEQLNEEESQRIGFTEDEWEDIRARVEADEELTQKLQAEERDKYSEVDQARMLVDLINQRKRYFVAQKAKAKWNKPMTQAQQRTYMSNWPKTDPDRTVPFWSSPWSGILDQLGLGPVWSWLFHGIKDAKTLWEAIKAMFGGNKESKKMHKTILKKQYENFTASRSEGLDKTYDRSLPSAWNNIALIMRNKADLDELTMEDLYNNLKVYEAKIKSQSSSSSNSQNVAFVSSDDTSSTNETVNIAHDVPAASPQLDNEDLEQIY
ncbi:hypothetical protein Tco_0964260, partial [Tanacetum coccineum]